MVNKAYMKGKGEGQTHISMNTFVFELMQNMGYSGVEERYPLQYRSDNSDNEWIRRDQGVYIEADVTGTQIIPGKDGYYMLRTIVFIDGEIHDNKIQKNKDKTAEQMIKELYIARPELGRYRIIRVEKDLVLSAMKSGKTGWLRKKLSLAN